MGKCLFDYKDLTAAWLVALRLICSGVLILLLAWKAKKGEILRVWKTKESAVNQLLFTVFGMTMCQYTYFQTIEYSNPATSTILQSAAPVLIMIYCLIREKRAPLVKEILVLCAVSLGVFLLATHGNIHSLAITQKALICGLASAVALAIYNVQPVRLLGEFGSLETVGWAMTVGGVLMIPLTRFWNVPGIWDWQTVLLTIGVIVFGTIIPFTMYLQGVLYIGPVKASLFACIEPLVASILSVFVLGTSFGIMDAAGMVCVLGSVTALSVSELKQ